MIDKFIKEKIKKEFENYNVNINAHKQLIKDLKDTNIWNKIKNIYISGIILDENYESIYNNQIKDKINKSIQNLIEEKLITEYKITFKLSNDIIIKRDLKIDSLFNENLKNIEYYIEVSYKKTNGDSKSIIVKESELIKTNKQT